MGKQDTNQYKQKNFNEVIFNFLRARDVQNEIEKDKASPSDGLQWPVFQLMVITPPHTLLVNYLMVELEKNVSDSKEIKFTHIEILWKI